MGQLHATRIQQEEAIEDAHRHPVRVQPRLDLLAKHLALLIAPVNQTIVVLHFWLFSPDLDHVIDICDFHWEALLGCLPAVDESLVLHFFAELVGV